MIEFEEYLIRRGRERIQSVIDIVTGHGLIGGSYAAHMATIDLQTVYDQPGDVDIFAFSADDADLIVKGLIMGGYFIDEENPIAISMTGSVLHAICDMPIQVIKPNPNWRTDKEGFRDDLLNSFDFNVCRAVLDGNIIIGDIELGTTEGRVLRVANPLRTMKRILKYRDRGFTFSDWELCKVFFAWGELKDERIKEIADAAQPQPVDESHDPYDWYDDDDYFDAE